MGTADHDLVILGSGPAGRRAAIEASRHGMARSRDGVEGGMVHRFDSFRKKSSVGIYERAGAHSDHEAEQMFGLGEDVRRRVTAWLRDRHPELLGPSSP